jgi:MoaA/NifB/PqqE/SkfB family radical SAM enzyme
MHNLELKLKKSKLKDIWIMLSQSCDHRCRNCFESTEKGIDKNPNNLSEKQILDVINRAIELGINEVGIPGAGEPFHPANIKTLFKVLENNFQKGIHTTIFTHLGFFNEEIIKKLNGYGDKITLLVKFNSFKPEVQDWFDNVEGYTKKRKEILDLLFKYKFNDGKRLGFVTSIMNINYKEIPEILKFCRGNNIIPDIDNILPRGRGEKSSFNPADKELKEMYYTLAEIDKKEFGRTWQPTCSYVGEHSCNRYCHHLFITKTGDVHPCIGSTHVLLGNIKEKDLKKMWESPEMKIIRARNYGGKCKKCKLFIEHKCNSCLGRYTENLNNKDLIKTGKVHTTGCWGFKEE